MIKVTDVNHAWNEGPTIRAKKQLCGCHITAKKIDLCELGKEFKYWADKQYGFYLSQKDIPCNTGIAEGCRNKFELLRKIYVTHLSTGWDWPTMMWGADRCL